MVHFIWVVSPTLDLLMVRILKRLKCRIVYTVHNPFPHENKDKLFKKHQELYRAVDSIIVLSHFTKNELINQYSIENDKISIIPHGDFETLFSRYDRNNALAIAVANKAAGRRIISFLGTLRPYKGLEYFIEAMPLIKMKNPDTFFLVAGSVIVCGGKDEWKAKFAGCVDDHDLWLDIRYIPTVAFTG